MKKTIISVFILILGCGFLAINQNKIVSLEQYNCEEEPISKDVLSSLVRDWEQRPMLSVTTDIEKGDLQNFLNSHPSIYAEFNRARTFLAKVNGQKKFITYDSIILEVMEDGSYLIFWGLDDDYRAGMAPTYQ